MKTTSTIPATGVALKCAAVPHLLTVIGFKVDDDTNFAMPVVAGAVEVDLACGDALVMAGGDVIDLKTGRRFESAEDMLGWVVEEGPYSPGAPLSDALKVARKPAKAAPAPVGPHSMIFGKKTYKLCSNWHFIHGDEKFVFQVPAATAVPDDARVTKITRDDLSALKKSGTPEKNYTYVIGEEEPQTEPETVEEDDDLDGLI